MVFGLALRQLTRIPKPGPTHLVHPLAKPLRTMSSASAPTNDDQIIPVHLLASQHQDRTAIQDATGEHTYRDLLVKAVRLSKIIQQAVGGAGTGQRIGFLCSGNVTYVVAKFAVWMSGNIAVPLSPLHPASLLSYYLKDCQASLVMAAQGHSKLVEAANASTGLPLLMLDDVWSEQEPPGASDNLANELPDAGGYQDADALILYTSGTTGPPKGVVLTHRNLDAQVRMLIRMWQWSASDVIVNPLPLHHTHGVVNALLCPLYIGARCILMPKFDAGAVWSHLLGVGLGPDEQQRQPTVFMGVPTMYAKLLDEYDRTYASNPTKREYLKAVCSNKIRVMISGSASLPDPVWHRWHFITGQRIVERYGMTEIGSVLSIPLTGPRRPGFVGTPAPGVRLRIAAFRPSPAGTRGPYDVLAEFDLRGLQSRPLPDEVTGDLLVYGANVFSRYWERPEATAKDFTSDGWFRTGDVVTTNGGYIKILGRASADIIKSGGYKISALQIETELLAHPMIHDCTVVGVPDPTWGQKVAAVLVLTDPAKSVDFEELRTWCKERMAPYMVPTVWRVLAQLPRNTLGKVNKVEFVKTAFPAAGQPSSKL